MKDQKMQTSNAAPDSHASEMHALRVTLNELMNQNISLKTTLFNMQKHHQAEMEKIKQISDAQKEDKNKP